MASKLKARLEEIRRRSIWRILIAYGVGPWVALGTSGIILSLLLLSSACNATAPEDFSIHGTWSGSVAELELELTMVLVGQGEVGILGIAELNSLPTGTVHGEVSGTLDGPDVALVIELEGAVVAGSLVFAGTIQGTDAIGGTLSSGLLGGSWPIEFQREEL